MELSVCKLNVIVSSCRVCYEEQTDWIGQVRGLVPDIVVMLCIFLSVVTFLLYNSLYQLFILMTVAHFSISKTSDESQSLG